MERVERSSSVGAEHDSDLGNDEDLEEMDSQLNPDAKEFVPVSPQRTSVSSPFGNGLHNRFDLMDDEVVSQSPRKGSTLVMDDNIVLPAENDFTEISQRPSELVANELNFDNVVPAENGGGGGGDGDGDGLKESKRPESSSSQCSYQEMNLKEAMHGDEKQELDAEVHEADNLFGVSDAVPTTNGGDQTFLTEEHPMNMSFYKDENNPFAAPESQEVDMNAVQPLPDYIDDENQENQENQENEFVDYVAQPIQVHNQNSYNDMDELVKEFSSEGEKLNLNQPDELIEQQHIEPPTPITDFVQELATEVTSILNEVEQQSNAAYDNVHDLMETDQHVSQSEINEASPGKQTTKRY